MLFYDKMLPKDFVLPWTVFTDPEIAHVGKYAGEIKALDIEYDTLTKFYQRLDRAVCEGKTRGFIRIFVKK